MLAPSGGHFFPPLFSLFLLLLDIIPTRYSGAFLSDRKRAHPVNRLKYGDATVRPPVGPTAENIAPRRVLRRPPDHLPSPE